jgi:hypothetical protein
MANSLNKPKAPKPFAGSKPVKRAALAKATKAPMVKSTAKPKAKSVTPAHLKELKTEAKRVKGLYDPTARPGFQFGKGTM